MHAVSTFLFYLIYRGEWTWHTAESRAGQGSRAMSDPGFKVVNEKAKDACVYEGGGLVVHYARPLALHFRV